MRLSRQQTNLVVVVFGIPPIETPYMYKTQLSLHYDLVCPLRLVNICKTACMSDAANKSKISGMSAVIFLVEKSIPFLFTIIDWSEIVSGRWTRWKHIFKHQ